MWSLVKEPLDSPTFYDKDGLEFAYRFFTTSILTNRLSGISQINSNITTFNSATLPEEEAIQIADNLADWFVGKDIINNIFGPNLHVEVSKRFYANNLFVYFSYVCDYHFRCCLS